jgi:hypothetical protein
VTAVALVHGVVEPGLELHWFSPVRNHTDISTKDVPYLRWQQVSAAAAAVLSCFHMLLGMN